MVIKTGEIDLNFFTVFYLSNLTELVSCSHTVNLIVVLYMDHILVLFVEHRFNMPSIRLWLVQNFIFVIVLIFVV